MCMIFFYNYSNTHSNTKGAYLRTIQLIKNVGSGKNDDFTREASKIDED